MKNLKQIVEELKKSEFECIGGYLVNFTAFKDLEEKANDIHSYCCLGPNHPCPLNVNDGFCAADTCQYKVKAI